MMLSDVCLSVTYIRPKSRTERPRKTKIGTEVAHFTRGSLSRSKGQRSTCRGRGILWRPPAQLVCFCNRTMLSNTVLYCCTAAAAAATVPTTTTIITTTATTTTIIMPRSYGRGY